MPKITEARFEENFPGAKLSPNETEFVMAIDRYKRLRHRPFPTWHEVYRVFLELGYRKQVPFHNEAINHLISFHF